jgi:hypothetical protein
MSREENARELLAIVKKNGGGNFTASVYLREDGFFIMFNVPFMERIARMGRADRFCELLKTHFEEALSDAQKESKRSVNGSACERGASVANPLPGVQVADRRGRRDAA